MKLYDLDSCPYCKMVRDRLNELNLTYEKVAVPRDRSQRQEVFDVSGQWTVPVLVDGDVLGRAHPQDVLGPQQAAGREVPPPLLALRRLDLVLLGRHHLHGQAVGPQPRQRLHVVAGGAHRGVDQHDTC